MMSIRIEMIMGDVPCSSYIRTSAASVSDERVGYRKRSTDLFQASDVCPQ